MAGLWEPMSGAFWSTPPAMPNEGWPLWGVIITALVVTFAAVAVLKCIAQRIKPNGWHLREYLGQIGGALTLTYLVIVAVVIWGRVDTLMTMPLNEVGDFLAGVFGPVAFLWLVFGFIQQGDELRQGTEALKMQSVELKQSTQALNIQAAELKKSVEQQSIMADAALQQIEAQKSALELQQKERERTLIANFSLTTTVSGSGSQPGTSMNKVRMRNDGNTAFNVTLTFSPRFLNCGEVAIGQMNRQADIEFELTRGAAFNPEEGTVQLSYEDVEGATRNESFTYRVVSGRAQFKKIRARA